MLMVYYSSITFRPVDVGVRYVHIPHMREKLFMGPVTARSRWRNRGPLMIMKDVRETQVFGGAGWCDDCDCAGWDALGHGVVTLDGSGAGPADFGRHVGVGGG